MGKNNLEVESNEIGTITRKRNYESNLFLDKTKAQIPLSLFLRSRQLKKNYYHHKCSTNQATVSNSRFQKNMIPYKTVLVVLGVLWVSQIEDDARVWSCTTTALGEDILEVDLTIEAEGTIGQDVDPVTLVVSWRVDNRDLDPLLAS
jgi:hypothetical protein